MREMIDHGYDVIRTEFIADTVSAVQITQSWAHYFDGAYESDYIVTRSADTKMGITEFTAYSVPNYTTALAVASRAHRRGLFMMVRPSAETAN